MPLPRALAKALPAEPTSEASGEGSSDDEYIVLVDDATPVMSRGSTKLAPLDPRDLKSRLADRLTASAGTLTASSASEVSVCEDDPSDEDSDGPAPVPPPKPRGLALAPEDAGAAPATSGRTSKWQPHTPKRASDIGINKVEIPDDSPASRKSPRDSARAALPNLSWGRRSGAKAAEAVQQHQQQQHAHSAPDSVEAPLARVAAALETPSSPAPTRLQASLTSVGSGAPVRGPMSSYGSDSSNRSPSMGTASGRFMLNRSRMPSFSVSSEDSPRSTDADGPRVSQTDEVAPGANVTLTPITVTTISRTIYYLVRVETNGASWVVPRTIEQVKDFRAQLLAEYPTAQVPAPPAKIFKGNVKEKSAGDRIAWLQTFLDALLADAQLAASVGLSKFLDPFYKPSPLALRAIQPAREGVLQFRAERGMSRTMKPMLCILKHDLYVFRSVDDAVPLEVVALDYCTIHLVPETADTPRFAFQVVTLREGDLFTLAAESTKELAEWILCLREAKCKRASFCQHTHEVPPWPHLVEARARRAPAVELLQRVCAGEDDAVLRREVETAHTALPAAPEWSAAGLVVDPSGEVAAGTPEQLLHVVFDVRRSDKGYVKPALTAFRYHSTPAQLLAVARRKMEAPGADAGQAAETRARVALVLEQWVLLHTADFLDSLVLARALVQLLLEHAALAAVVRPALQRLPALGLGPPPPAPPPALLPSILRGTAFDLLDLAPLELARQIALVQHPLFAAIPAREFLTEAWSGPEGPQRAPFLTSAIANFNQLCGWITSLLVSTTLPIPRISLLHRFIDIAQCSVDLHNYNGAMAVLGALLANPVHRLRDDWAALPADSQDVFTEIKGLFSTAGNWKLYRAAIAAAAPPALPYLGLALQDLTFHETKSSTRTVDARVLWNVDKGDRVAAVVAELQRFQEVPFNFKPLPAVEQYLLRGAVLSADEQDALSFALRPKNADSASPRKVAWRKEFGSPRREAESGMH